MAKKEELKKIYSSEELSRRGEEIPKNEKKVSFEESFIFSPNSGIKGNEGSGGDPMKSPETSIPKQITSTIPKSNLDYEIERNKRRANEIPSVGKKRSKRSPFIVDEDLLSFSAGNKKSIPASIEYYENKQERGGVSEAPDYDQLLFDGIPKNIPRQVEQRRSYEEMVGDYKDEEIVDFSKTPLAEESEINELERKHMHFYSILSKIQDTHVASDFKSAYDIQDRISYLLNHKTLLYKSLVSELLIYLDSIIEKMDKYYEEMAEKQKKFNRYNRKVSELQKYKFKTDESMKIIDNSQEIVHREIDIQQKNAEETP